MGESTDLGNESMLLGRFPKDSLLDNTESTVSGLWGQGQRQVILGLWSRTQGAQKPQTTMILSTVIFT